MNEGYSKYLCNFQEQSEWAVSRDVDYIIGETFPELEETLLALKGIQEYGKDTFNVDIRLRNEYIVFL